MASVATKITRSAIRSTSSTPFLHSATIHEARFAAAPQAFRRQTRRGFASGHSPLANNNTGVFWSLGLAAAGSVGYFAYARKQSPTPKTKTEPAEEAKAEARKEQKHSSFVPKQEDYQKVYNAIAQKLVDEDEYDDGSYGPIVLRLGWHASGTYDAATGTGGSNGATMRFDPESDHGANNGMKNARDFLESIKAQFPWISYSDLWTLASVCAVQEMQGPAIPWRPGRQDRDVGFCTPDGRLPDGAKGPDHLRAIFGRMGFDDREIVALSGAHALGRCHADRSGFDGPWTFSPTVMTNDYFKFLVDYHWYWRKWDGNRQFEDKESKSLMMLPTDMALVQDKKFRPHVERYAKDEAVFFKEFADAVCKLFELGVPFTTGEEARMRFQKLED
ncbi:MAG: heme peroxidase [Bogoriella megaspora]|nr:MAG: heme peroxidase [Bogoriella megaspora]